MQNKLSFNFTHKLNIKGFFDIVCFIIAGVIICTFVYFSKTSLVNLSMLIIILSILYAVQYHISKAWIEKTIFSAIYKQINSTTDKTSSILTLINSQKNMATKHLSDATNYASVIENMKTISQQIRDLIRVLSEKTHATLSFSNKEKESITVASEKIYGLKQKMQIVAETILDLSHTLQQIKNNLSVVEDITEQTNMLALNASVEAARAGEYGKGFAIVASEIRKLSEEAKETTNKIESMLTTIQNSANTSVLATEDSNKEVEIVLKASKDTLNIIGEMTQLVNEISQPIEQINSHAENQNIYSAQIHTSLIDVSNWLNEFLKSVEESAAEINSLNNMSTGLKENIFDE